MIVFDPAKDAANIAKHGVSLSLAAEMDFDTLFVRVDDRHDYGEVRYTAYGLIKDAWFALTYTPRGADIRAISLRRVRGKELRRWGVI